MTIYTNPTGTFDATPGDDTIIFNSTPSDATITAIDALGGQDSLLMQFDYFQPATFDVSDWNNSDAFMTTARYGAYGPVVIVYNAESVELHGTANDDTFHVQLGTGGSSGLTANMDGGAGQDLLRLDVSKLSTAFNFIVSGAAVSSSWGTFTNFEKFEVRSGSGDDTITTGSGDDNIYTGTGIDSVNAGAGNDQIYSQSSGGTFDGGLGSDYYSGDFSAQSAALSVTVGNTITVSNGVNVLNVESYGIAGGSGNDAFTVNRDGGGVTGGAGSDSLTYNVAQSSALQVNITAYSGNQLDGSIGSNFSFSQLENVSISGTQLDDQFWIGGSGIDFYIGSGVNLDGGAGNDFLNLDFGLYTSGVSLVVSSNGTILSSLGNLSSIERFNLTGGSGADTFVTGSANDRLSGGAGADYLDGGNGDDTIIAGANTAMDGAADVLIGGGGNDAIFAGYGDAVDGGSGTDRLFYDATNGTDGITADFAQLAGGGSITVAGATIKGVEVITGVNGTDFNDVVTIGGLFLLANGGPTIDGFGGDDSLTGSASSDTIRGGTGNDTIGGGDGFDNLSGDEGNDIITGGAGQDQLSGGDGNDTFLDTGAGLNGDTISGFTPQDKIIITDASLNGFNFTYANGTLSFAGASVTVRAVFPGTFVANAAPGGGVELDFQPAPVATIDQIANQLTTGYWDGDTHRWAVTQGGTLTVNISTLTAAEQALARAALAEWTDIIGVNFQEVVSGAKITFDNREGASGSIAATDSVWANGIITSAHIQISSSWVNQYGTRLDGYGFQTYVHEIGHALGLGHAGNYNFTGTYTNDAIFLNDSWATSVMSYFDQGKNFYFADQRFTILDAVTPMQADIVALQQLYGLSTATRTGDTVYGVNSNAGGIYDAGAYPNVSYTIFDSGGNDTLSFWGASGAQLLNLNPETFSNANGYTGNLSIARGVIIENAVGGGGADTIIGNGVGNVLTGNGGNDMMTGGAGNDAFRDTAAGHNGDTVTDFSRGDSIVIADATLAGFTFSLSGNQMSFTGGSMTLSNLNHASIAASAAPEGGVRITFAGPPIVLSAGTSISSSTVAQANAQSGQIIGMPLASLSPDQPDFRDDRPTGWHASISHWDTMHLPQADLFALA